MDKQEEILGRLDKQDHTLEQVKNTLDQVMWILKGSENLPIEGVLPSLKRISKEVKIVENDIRDIKEWRNDVIQSRGKLDMKEAAKWLAFLGVAVGLVTTVTHFVWEWLDKISK